MKTPLLRLTMLTNVVSTAMNRKKLTVLEIGAATANLTLNFQSAH
jgi:16S rRNA A1518/A1519 N6-dimethyltransferase RsmA/KsgA/DIM1 with predicted DNA glycosylase/AP lyase activity